MREIPKHTIHPPKKRGLPGHVRIQTPSGFPIVRDIAFKYDYKDPSKKQEDELIAHVIKSVQIHEDQYADIFSSVGKEDTEIECEQVWIGGEISREDYYDNHPRSLALKEKLASVFKYYENKQFFPYSPTVFDLFQYDKLNRYQIGITKDNFIYLYSMKISDKLFSGCIPILFNSFNHKNFYTHRGIRFTFIHDLIAKTKRVKWHFPISPVIPDYKKIPIVPDSMIFESQRTFDVQGILVSSGARIFADHELVDEICLKHRIPHPLPEDYKERKIRPWAYDITFDDHGRILEVAALVKLYRRKEKSLTFKSSY